MCSNILWMSIIFISIIVISSTRCLSFDLSADIFCLAKNFPWNVQQIMKKLLTMKHYFPSLSCNARERRTNECECVPKMCLVIVFRTRASHNEIRHDDVPWILLLTLKKAAFFLNMYSLSIFQKFRVDVKSIHTFCHTRNTKWLFRWTIDH